MGMADTLILISGDQAAFEKWHPVLQDLAGNYVNLGARIEAAATMDLSTLSYVYGAFLGFLHGALIAESESLDVGQFGALVAAISPSFGAFFAMRAESFNPEISGSRRARYGSRSKPRNAFTSSRSVVGSTQTSPEWHTACCSGRMPPA